MINIYLMIILILSGIYVASIILFLVTKFSYYIIKKCQEYILEK